MDPSKFRRTQRGTYVCRWGDKCFYLQKTPEANWRIVGTEGTITQCVYKAVVETIREAQKIVKGFYIEDLDCDPAGFAARLREGLR